MFALFAVGSLYFWALLLIPFLVLCYLVENEKSISAAVLSVAAIAAGVLLVENAPQWLLAHWPLVIGGYIVSGILWGAGRWIFFVWRYLDAFKQVREEFLAETKAKTITDENRQAFKKALESKSYRALGRYCELTLQKPRAAKNKSRIIFWMTYWPASLLWTFINDPVRRFWEFVLRRFEKVFDRISNHMFRKYASDFED